MARNPRPITRICFVGATFRVILLAIKAGISGKISVITDRDSRFLTRLENMEMPWELPRDFKEKLGDLINTGKLVFSPNIEESAAASSAVIIDILPEITSAGSADYSTIKAITRTIGKGIGKTEAGHTLGFLGVFKPGFLLTEIVPALEGNGPYKSGRDFFTTHLTFQFSADKKEISKCIMGSCDTETSVRARHLPLVFTQNVISMFSTDSEALSLIDSMLDIAAAGIANEMFYGFSALGVNPHDVIKYSKIFDGRLNALNDYPLGFYDVLHRTAIAISKSVFNEVKRGQWSLEPLIYKAAVQTSSAVPQTLVQIGLDVLKDYKDVKAAVLGLSAVPDSADVEETPAMPLVKTLMKMGARVNVYDPYSIELFRTKLKKRIENGEFGPWDKGYISEEEKPPGWAKEYEKKLEDRLSSLPVKFFQTARDALAGCQILFVVSRHREFETITPSIIKSAMAVPVVVDGARVFDGNLLAEEGIKYLSL
ncbi:MAG: UDP binding domain-containing protein, partial [Thermoplasmata archaeon]